MRLSFEQFKAIGGSDCLAPIGRSGYGRLVHSNFDMAAAVMLKRRMTQLQIRLPA
jgi:hypothetical protein